MKKGAKRCPKMNEKSSLEHPRFDFLRFWSAFRRGRFRMNFRWTKSGSQMRKKATRGVKW